MRTTIRGARLGRAAFDLRASAPQCNDRAAASCLRVRALLEFLERCEQPFRILAAGGAIADVGDELGKFPRGVCPATDSVAIAVKLFESRLASGVALGVAEQTLEHVADHL